MPLACEKTVTPTTELVFCGLTLTTFPELQIKVPQDKRDAAASLIKTFLVRRKVRVREIQSLVGKLNFLCQAVSVGRPFLRRLYDLVSKHKIKTHRVSLKIPVKKDLQLWLTFLDKYNGMSMIPKSITSQNCDGQLFPDASGKISYGAYVKGHYLCGV